MLLADLAHRGAVLWPSRVAFVWDTGRTRTYGEVAARAGRLGAVFAAGGVRPGDRIALLTCLLTNRGWIAATANAVHGLGVTGEDRLLATLPLFHVAGYGAALAHLAMGGTVVIPDGAGLDEHAARCATPRPGRSGWCSAWRAPSVRGPWRRSPARGATTGACTARPRRATS